MSYVVGVRVLVTSLILLVADAFASVRAHAQAQVDLELVLAVDASGSMSGEEQKFQRAGYVAAIAHPDVIRAIRSGPNRRIALAYIEWAGSGRQAITMPWQIISDAASAQAFAEQLKKKDAVHMRLTSISSMLAFSAKYFMQNNVRSPRKVIDVSGDGPNNDGVNIVGARDDVLAQGIVINGLPIMLDPTIEPGLDVYYKHCVIGGPGAFVLPVLRKVDWTSAIRNKMILEIAGRPARLMKAQWRPLEPKPAEADCLIGEKLRKRWG